MLNYKVFKAKTLTTLFSLFYLTACEQGPQTIEESYLNEVENYDKKFRKEKNELEDLLEAPPFVKSSNSQLNEIRNAFYQKEYSPKLDSSCKENIDKKTLALPKIKIIAESHQCPNCVLDFAKNLISAREGNIILAVEDHYTTPENEAPERGATAQAVEHAERENLPPFLVNLSISNKLAFGIDENSSLSTLFICAQLLINQKKFHLDAPLNLRPKNLFSQMNTDEGELTTVIYRALTDFLIDRERDEILKLIAKDNLSLEKNITLLLSKMLQNRESVSDSDKLGTLNLELINSHLTFKRLSMFLEKAIKARIQLFIQENSASSSKELIDYLSSNPNLNDPKNLDLVAELFTLDIRNKVFAQNIADVYCKISLEEQRDLIVTVGAAHANAQKYLLDQMFSDLKLQPVVEVEKADVKHMSWTITQRKKDVAESLKEIQSYK
jgi:hypothetical protein